jgi:hypothetical protein
MEAPIEDPEVDDFSLVDLYELDDRRDGRRVSLALPTHRVSAQAGTDRILLGDLAKAARDELLSLGERESDADALLHEVLAWSKDVGGFAHMAEGLVVFVADGFMRPLRLPYEVSPAAVVADRFHLAPLLPRVTEDDPFWLLGVSAKTLRLWLAGRWSLVDRTPADVPTSVAEALALQEREPGAGWRPVGAAGTVIHAHGGAPETGTSPFDRFVEIVAPRLEAAMRDGPDRLVVAAVEADVGAIRRHPALGGRVVASVGGNPDRVDLRQLQQAAWASVAPEWAAAVGRSLDRVADSLGTGLTLEEPAEVVEAAENGRLDALAVVPGTTWWGRPEAPGSLHDRRQPGDVDLVAVASVATLRHGGRVLPAPADRFESSVVALARF